MEPTFLRADHDPRESDKTKSDKNGYKGFVKMMASRKLDFSISFMRHRQGSVMQKWDILGLSARKS